MPPGQAWVTEVEVPGKTVATTERRVAPPFLSATLTGPVSVGALAGLLLVGVYLGLVTWAQDLTHARDLLWGERTYGAKMEKIHCS